MLFSKEESLEEIWQAVKHELHRGALDPNHPFRYVNLGTMGKVLPQVRTVVLREITQHLEFLVFTDFRSEKVKEIRDSSSVVLHFYHPKKMLQIRVDGLSEIHFQDEISDHYWRKIPEVRKSEYTGRLAPAAPISSPDLGWETGEKSFFTVLKISPQRIEALQLSKMGHFRMEFEKTEDWKGQWLVP